MQTPQHIPRRTALRWFATLTASTTLLPPFLGKLLGNDQPSTPAAKGYGLDPDLTQSYAPGAFWPLTLSQAERETASLLADVILPADGASSPAASTVGVVDLIDEFVSAPYPSLSRFRVLPTGLQWLEAESKRRFEAEFRDLTDEQRHSICDDLCLVQRAKPEFKEAAEFFTLFRFLTMLGYYTTPVGMKDIGYVGNVALTEFAGPPEDLLKKLGIE